MKRKSLLSIALLFIVFAIFGMAVIPWYGPKAVIAMMIGFLSILLFKYLRAFWMRW